MNWPFLHFENEMSHWSWELGAETEYKSKKGLLTISRSVMHGSMFAVNTPLRAHPPGICDFFFY